MPIAFPIFVSRFVHYLGIGGSVSVSELGPDYRLPEDGIFKQAEFIPAAGAAPGRALFWVAPRGIEKQEDVPSFKLQLLFARREFFTKDAPDADSTIDDIQRLSEPFIGKKGHLTVTSRLIATEHDLQQASLVRPLIGLASRSGGHSIKLTGAQYEISPPPTGEMSWTFRELDRAIVTEASARLSSLENNSPQEVIDQFAAAFEIFVVGSKRIPPEQAAP
jgi:hypothetical protein